MAKTTIANLIARIKRRIDYDITDTDLDTLVVDCINDGLKTLKQLLFDNGFSEDITKQATYQTIESQAYRDITKAVITGDTDEFTGVAGDKIDVWIDGTEYDDIDVSAATTIALVVAAINSAVGSTVAYEDDNGYLRIESLTTGASSAVIIEDDGAASGAVDSLFSDSDYREDNAITDLDEILVISERENDDTPDIIPYVQFRKDYPDPSAYSSSSPDDVARHYNRIYHGPTPSGAVLMYLDYIFDITEVTSSDSSPFDNRFDPLIVAMAREEVYMFLDPSNAVALAKAQETRERLKHQLIVGAVKSTGMNRQVQSRRESRDWGPRSPLP